MPSPDRACRSTTWRGERATWWGWTKGEGGGLDVQPRLGKIEKTNARRPKGAPYQCQRGRGGRGKQARRRRPSAPHRGSGCDRRCQPRGTPSRRHNDQDKPPTKKGDSGIPTAPSVTHHRRGREQKGARRSGGRLAHPEVGGRAQRWQAGSVQQPAPLMASGDATLKTDLQATLWTFHSFFMIKQSCLEDRSAGSGRPTATATPHRPPHPLRAARHPPLLAHLSAAMSSGQPNGPRRRLYSAWITGICRQRQRPAVTASGKALERAYARHGDGGGSRRGGRRRGGGPR